MTEENVKLSDIYNKELTLEELFQLIIKVEYNLKTYIYELEIKIKDLEKDAHTHASWE
jgi:hypothetical protein